jgi:hypothetical protein
VAHAVHGLVVLPGQVLEACRMLAGQDRLHHGLQPARARLSAGVQQDKCNDILFHNSHRLVGTLQETCLLGN